MKEVANEERNLMSSHSLSIVLAPNLLPFHLDESLVIAGSTFHGEDVILASNIDIIHVREVLVILK